MTYVNFCPDKQADRELPKIGLRAPLCSYNYGKCLIQNVSSNSQGPLILSQAILWSNNTYHITYSLHRGLSKSMLLSRIVGVKWTATMRHPTPLIKLALNIQKRHEHWLKRKIVRILKAWYLSKNSGPLLRVPTGFLGTLKHKVNAVMAWLHYIGRYLDILVYKLHE